MKKILTIVPRWFPALLMMSLIFTFSSQPGADLPNFLGWDYFVKKTSHAIGYGLLALSYLFWLNNKNKRYWLAWLMAFAFSVTDELHQSFMPGRHASLQDVIIFDNLGALAGLYLHSKYRANDEEKKSHGL